MYIGIKLSLFFKIDPRKCKHVLLICYVILNTLNDQCLLLCLSFADCVRFGSGGGGFPVRTSRLALGKRIDTTHWSKGIFFGSIFLIFIICSAVKTNLIRYFRTSWLFTKRLVLYSLYCSLIKNGNKWELSIITDRTLFNLVRT